MVRDIILAVDVGEMVGGCGSITVILIVIQSVWHEFKESGCTR